VSASLGSSALKNERTLGSGFFVRLVFARDAEKGELPGRSRNVLHPHEATIAPKMATATTTPHRRLHLLATGNMAKPFHA
jgi:hypothetical protein